MEEAIKKVLELSRSPKNTLPTLARNAKISEETGEFSQALLHKLGFLPHKTLDEPLMGEAADSIICILDTLASAYPEMTEEELFKELGLTIMKKSQKWDKVMNIKFSLSNKVTPVS